MSDDDDDDENDAITPQAFGELILANIGSVTRVKEDKEHSCYSFGPNTIPFWSEFEDEDFGLQSMIIGDGEYRLFVCVTGVLLNLKPKGTPDWLKLDVKTEITQPFYLKW